MIALAEEESHVSWGTIFSPAFRGPMLAGVGLAVISAFDGINAFMCGPAGSFRLCLHGTPVMEGRRTRKRTADSACALLPLPLAGTIRE